MPVERAALTILLDALERAVPDMLSSNPDEADFWAEFTGEADEISDRARPQDVTYVRGRLDCMLKNAGMIPGEEEGEPCK